MYQNSGCRGRDVRWKTVTMYSPTSSSMIYYTERQEIHQYQVSCTHENDQAHFTEGEVLQCSRAQLPKQVQFFALNSRTQGAGLMLKVRGQSRARVYNTGHTFKARGGISSVLCVRVTAVAAGLCKEIKGRIQLFPRCSIKVSRVKILCKPM